MAQTDSIDSLTWEAVNRVGSELSIERKDQDNQVRSQKVRQTSQAKDVLTSAGNKSVAVRDVAKGNEAPSLPVPPQSGKNSIWGDPDAVHTLSLIAIIGKVALLQADQDQKYYMNLYKQATQNMLIQVKFAPLIAAAIKNQALQESKATLSDANKEMETGIIDLVGFGASVALGVGLAASEGAFSSTNKATNATNESENGTSGEAAERNGAGPGQSGDIELQEMNREEQTTDQIDNEQKSFLERGKDTAQDVGKAQMTAMQRFAKIMERISNVSMMIGQGTKGTTEIISSGYDSKKAAHQAEAGKYGAFSKQFESFQQFYGQAYSRGEDLRSKAAQQFDYVLQIWKEITDQVTSTTRSMFQG